MNTVETPQDQPVNEPLKGSPVVTKHIENVHKFSKTNPIRFTLAASALMLILVVSIAYIAKPKSASQTIKKNSAFNSKSSTVNVSGVNPTTGALSKAPTITPSPAPTSASSSTSTSSNSSPTSAPSVDSSGVATTPTSLSVTVAQGSTLSNAFSFKSNSATQFSINPYPVSSLGTGIVLSPTSGGLSSGQTVNVSISVGSTVQTGTYTGYAVYTFQPGNVSKNTPLTIVVQSPPTSAPAPTSSSTSSSYSMPTSGTFRGATIDKNNNITSFPGFSVTITDMSTGQAVGTYSGPTWSTDVLTGGHMYHFVASGVSGYSASNMSCYNCTSPSAYSYSGGSTFDQMLSNSGTYYGVFFKYQ